MSAYLAPRSSQRPASATLQRRMQTSSAAREKTFSSHSKSVRFEDPSAAKNTSRNVNTKEKRFHFLRKKKKDEEGTPKPGDPVFTPGICDSPSSIRSAPSTVGHAVVRGRRVNSPIHSLDGGDVRSRSPAQSEGPMGTDNLYTLYAVCNHHGTMTRGHYTAYCRNPTDGQWYVFDDSHVQAISEEQLITAGAYLLFYVRHSLLNPFPPLSSASSSSSSSGSSSHWAMHIPRFRLDLGGSLGSSDDAHSPSNDAKATHSRFSSANSAISAPNGNRGFSPQSLVHDNGSDVFLHSRGGLDNRSATSLPSSSGPRSHLMRGHSSSLHHHQHSPAPEQQQLSPSSSSKPRQHGQPSAAAVAAAASAGAGLSGRHASLRLGRQRHLSPDNLPITSEHLYRRGTSFHGSHNYHDMLQRSLTDSGRELEVMPPHPAYPSSGQGLSIPSRSIPNMMAAEYAMSDQGTMHPLPSRSIPDIMAAATPSTPSARSAHPHNSNYGMHFMTPQPHRPHHAYSRSYSTSQSGAPSGTESCV